MDALGYIASFVMGVVLGLMGGGGSILTVPIMVYLFGAPPTVATGYSLFIVGITACAGSVAYVRRGEVDLKAGLLFAVPSVIAVNVARGLVVPVVPDVLGRAGALVITKEILIMVAFAALMVAASFSMIRKSDVKKTTSQTGPKGASLISLQGLVVGSIAGFVGAGGGFLIVPALSLLAGLPMRVAVGTSLLVIAMQSLLGFAGDIARGAEVEWLRLFMVAAIAVAGILSGSTIAHRFEERQLKVAFGWFVLVMGFAILTEQALRL